MEAQEECVVLLANLAVNLSPYSNRAKVHQGVKQNGNITSYS